MSLFTGAGSLVRAQTVHRAATSDLARARRSGRRVTTRFAARFATLDAATFRLTMCTGVQ
jgi:hypothetical protein